MGNSTNIGIAYSHGITLQVIFSSRIIMIRAEQLDALIEVGSYKTRGERLLSFNDSEFLNF